MATKTSSKTRKPSLSTIKAAERQKLVLVGRSATLNNQLKRVEINLNNLEKSKVRLKLTKRVQLQKSKSKLKKQLGYVDERIRKIDSRLKGYTSITW